MTTDSLAVAKLRAYRLADDAVQLADSPRERQVLSGEYPQLEAAHRADDAAFDLVAAFALWTPPAASPKPVPKIRSKAKVRGSSVDSRMVGRCPPVPAQPWPYERSGPRDLIRELRRQVLDLRGELARLRARSSRPPRSCR